MFAEHTHIARCSQVRRYALVLQVFRSNYSGKQENKKRTHDTRHKIDGNNSQLKCDKAADANADGDA